jgi:hypothetical protein
VEGRRSRPEETPPSRQRGRVFTWLASSIAATVGIGLFVLAVVVALVVLLG